MCVLILLSLVLGVVVEGQFQESRVVQIDQGPVRGYKEPERDLYAFYNIPYATAPTGRDKYKAPLPPLTWTKTYEAVNKCIICPQDLSVTLNTQEDCLIANVFVPDTNHTNMPVMVVVHGGEYQVGYGSKLPFKTFSEMKNVIVVTFNYRLSAHGFLCLGTENIPGNAGMKDQVALLRWVNRNIGNFDGNPNDVTIMGCSAGGSSVDLLAISNATKGLFQKVIVNSSAHLSPYSVQIDPIAAAKKHASKLNFTDVNDFNALEEFYLETPLDLLLSGTYNLANKDTSVAFSPCIENDIGQEIFLEYAPIDIISRGDYAKYPILYGFTDLEGKMFLNSFNMWKNEMNENFENFLPADLEFENNDIRIKIGKMAKEMYFNNVVNDTNILGFIHYYTDTLFSYSMLRSVELQKKFDDISVFLYFYSFYDETNAPIPHTEYRGAEHCDQTNIISDSDQTNMTKERKNMISVMRDIYSNFITTGQPVVNGSPIASWPAVGVNSTPYLSIGRTIELKSSLLESRYRFWTDIYQEHYRRPRPPQPVGH